MLQNAYFLRYSRKTDFFDLAMPKMSYIDTDARATFLHLVPLCNFVHTFFRVCGTNLAQETIQKSLASCSNDHAHFLAIRVCYIFRILAYGGRRDFLNTPKCSQWPCLYTTHAATYALKRLFPEIFSKNRFFDVAMPKISYFDIDARLYERLYKYFCCVTVYSSLRIFTDVFKGLEKTISSGENLGK